MPIFMDRHDIPGLTAMDVAEGHKQDLMIQHKYGCRALTYWFDEKRGTAFCLIEAPKQEAVEKMHDEAHGLIPRKIIQVDSHVVEAFLGRISDPDTAVKANDSDLLVFKDPAFRTILATELKDALLVKSRFGVSGSLKLLEMHNAIIQETITEYNGQVVKKSVDGFMASFNSATKAVKCAVEIQMRFRASNLQMSVKIGLSAGEPVTGKDDFFGEVIQFAKRLCYISDEGQVMVSSTVRDEYKREGVNLLSEEEAIRILNQPEEQFLNRLMDIIEKVWNEEELNVHDFAKQIGLSKAQLYRKITALTGIAPHKFIKEFRLKKAIELIEKQQGNISQIAFETGFSNPSYFSKCFQKRFGILPSDFASTLV